MNFNGKPKDEHGRCQHYADTHDVVSYRFACCDGWWPCHECHEETATHRARPWPASRFDKPSVLCGACKAAFRVPDYVAAADKETSCPECKAAWNPGCKPHWPRYFENIGSGR